MLQGRVIGGGGEGPVATALVRLVDEEGARLAISIADSAGVYRVEAPGPETYRLQAERVGYEPTETPLLRAVNPDGVFNVDLVMTATPVEVITRSPFLSLPSSCATASEDGIVAAVVLP